MTNKYKIINNLFLISIQLQIFKLIITSPIDSKLITNNNNNNNINNLKKSSVDLEQMDDTDKISIIMATMLPSMFGLFSNITDQEYKSNFHEPCTFDKLLEIFGKLPPYFDQIGKKYPTKPDLVAYYSMQLASTFLVNNGSLTMSCLYNMLSLQTRLQTFSLDLMDNPEKNMPLVGYLGIFMKPMMNKLKKNSMMKIIEHVDKYEKNDDLNTITLFNFFNIFYCLFGLCAILSNIFLIILLNRKRHINKKLNKKSNMTLSRNTTNNTNNNNNNTNDLNSSKISKSKKPNNINNNNNNNNTKMKIYKPLLSNPSEILKSSSESSSTSTSTSTSTTTKPVKVKVESKSIYKQVKDRSYYLNQLIRKKYKTRLCFILIAICHSAYIFINFIIMSQASLAAVALQGLTKMNIACKMSFFLFPPTTAYNILHQIYIWLLVYIIRKHSIKLRLTNTHNFDENADYHVDLMNLDESEQDDDDDYDQYDDDDDNDDYVFESNLYNTNPLRFNNTNSLVPFNNHATTQRQIALNTYSTYKVKKNSQNNKKLNLKNANNSNKGSCCGLFSSKRKNLQFFLFLTFLLLSYNAQNLFLYSLNKLKYGNTNTIYFCAFEEAYADHYTILTQFLIPLMNLILFSIIPLLLCSIQVLFDICFLVRVKREQMKRYLRLKEIIEWPVYAYFLVLLISQLPFTLHQVIDLINGTTKFPFVFPLFIQLKFSNKTWLVIIEQTLIFFSLSSDLYLWLICDRQFRELALSWLNKRILCRSYSVKNKKINEKNQLRISSSSNTSVMNDDSIKSQIEIKTNGQCLKNGYESSTLTSTTSSTNKKKQLSINLADSIKAQAAIPSSIQHNSVYPYEKSISNDSSPANPINNNNNNMIKMIDTDNDELDNFNDFSTSEKKISLERLSENENDDDLLNKNYLNSLNISNPPSFKTVTKKYSDKSEYENV